MKTRNKESYAGTAVSIQVKNVLCVIEEVNLSIKKITCTFHYAENTVLLDMTDYPMINIFIIIEILIRLKK
jgi:hypothetical protein